jgi:anti-anti-sigma factor
MSELSRVHVAVHTEGAIVRATVAGEIDLGNADQLQAALVDAIDNTTEHVELDLTNVAYVDSAGLHVLSTLVNRLRLMQVTWRIVAPPRSPARFAIEVAGLAAICGLDTSPPL